MKTMKKLTYLLLMIAAVSFTACSNNDDDNNDGDGNTGEEYLTAKVDGVNFEAAQTPAVIVSATNQNGVLVVQGGQNDSQTIRINIFNYNGVGSYTSGDNITNTNSMSYSTLSPVVSWVSSLDTGSGTLQVTSDDGTTIEGTFSFEGYNSEDGTTKNITDGKFKAILE